MNTIKTATELMDAMFNRKLHGSSIETKALDTAMGYLNTDALVNIMETTSYLTTSQFQTIWNQIKQDYEDNGYSIDMSDILDRILIMQIDHFDSDDLEYAMDELSESDVTEAIETFDEEIFSTLVSRLDWETITSYRLWDLEIPVDFIITHSQTIFANNHCDTDALAEYYDDDADSILLLERLHR